MIEAIRQFQQSRMGIYEHSGMVGGKAIELDINDWSTVLLALCGTRGNEVRVHKHLLGIAARIATHLAEALGIDGPKLGR